VSLKVKVLQKKIKQVRIETILVYINRTNVTTKPVTKRITRICISPLLYMLKKNHFMERN